MSDGEKVRYGKTIGWKMGRTAGELWSYPDADAALALN
jgi:hypothetical protein